MSNLEEIKEELGKQFAELLSSPKLLVEAFKKIERKRYEKKLKEQFPEGLPKIQNALELVSKDVKRDWVIEGLAPRGSVGFLFGQAGVGKTWMGLHIAKCVSHNEEFFSFPCKGSKVLYFAEEDKEVNLCERLKKLNIQSLAGAQLEFLCRAGFRADEDRWWDFLEYILANGDYAMVIMDNWSFIKGAINENEESGVTEVIRKFIQIAEKYNVYILILHHARKSYGVVLDPLDEMRGSSALRNLPDQVFRLRETEIAGRYAIDVIKNRDGASHFSIVFEVNFSEDKVTFDLVSLEKWSELKVEKVKKAIIEIFETEAREMRRKEIIGRLKGFAGEGTINEALRALVKAEILIKEKAGKETIYRLARGYVSKNEVEEEE